MNEKEPLAVQLHLMCHKVLKNGCQMMCYSYSYSLTAIEIPFAHLSVTQPGHLAFFAETKQHH